MKLDFFTHDDRLTVNIVAVLWPLFRSGRLAGDVLILLPPFAAVIGRALDLDRPLHMLAQLVLQATLPVTHASAIPGSA